MPEISLPPRFWAKVDKTSDCWEWTGARVGGYGRFLINPRTPQQRGALAHRVAYEALVGPIPDGLELDHLCGNRGCVRVGHLEPVTHEENIRRYWARRTHCPNGHPVNDETRVSDYRGGFRCLLCRRAAGRAANRRLRARLALPS